MFIHTYIRRERFVLRNWLTQLWGLASLKSAEEAGRLGTPGGADIAVLSLKTQR